MLCLALCVAWPTMAFALPIEETSASMTAPELCRNLLQVSLAKLRPAAPAPDRSAIHARMHSRPGPPPETASVELRLLVGGGMGARGPAGLESVVAWREPSGGWFARRSEEPAPDRVQDPGIPLAPVWPDPSPKPYIAGLLPEPGGLRLSSGALSPAEGAQLDRALDGASCLSLEPSILPALLPLRAGRSESCPPDSAWRELEIRQGDRVRRYVRACRSIGPVGLIGDTLDGAALPGAPAYRTRADLYNGTELPTAPALRDFLLARLPGLRYRDIGSESLIAGVRRRDACAMTLALDGRPGASREVELVLVQPRRAYARWLGDGVVALGEGGTDPALVATDTVLALQVQGALFHLAHLCSAQP
jgi:hypothetical protein